MKIRTNLQVDEPALEQIIRQHPEGLRLPLEKRIYIPYLFFVSRVMDGAGNDIQGWKTGYWLGRGAAANLEALPVFDVSGDRHYLAIHFCNQYEEEVHYLLEYFDDIFFLVRQHDALEDPELRGVFQRR